MMSTYVRFAVAVVLIGGLAAAADASYITGFEESDGFTVSGDWPEGWPATTGVRVGTYWDNGGSQSLEVGLQAPYSRSVMSYTLATAITPQPGVVTEVSVDIRASLAAQVPLDWATVGFGYFTANGIDGGCVGAVLFNKNYGSFNIKTADPQNPAFVSTGEYFAPGSSYHFATLIDWSAGTTTVRLTDLGGSLVHQVTVNSLPNGVKSFHFYGPDYSDSFPAYFDNFYVGDVPEPATMSLLALGGLAVLRRRRK